MFPDRPVFMIFGDGACGYSLIEFDTYSRHRFSVGAIIGTDACWSQIARDQMSMFNSNVAVCLSVRIEYFTNISKLAILAQKTIF